MVDFTFTPAMTALFVRYVSTSVSIIIIIIIIIGVVYRGCRQSVSPSSGESKSC